MVSVWTGAGYRQPSVARMLLLAPVIFQSAFTYFTFFGL